MSDRAKILDTARKAITVDRAATHGDAEDTFARIAGLWSLHLHRDVSPHDVAVMMVMFKLARIQGNPTHVDSYVDAAGYMAIAAELAVPHG